MKKTLLTLAYFTPFILVAQTTLLDENFDGYTSGNYIGNESANFTTWSNAPGTGEDAFIVNTVSSSPSNSVSIMGNAGPTDVMMTFPSIYTSGKYEFSMKLYVATGKGGYFNIQETQTAGQGWKLDVFFSSGGIVEILGGSTAGTAQYTQAAWTDVKVVINLDTDNADVYINGNMVHSYVFSSGSDGTGTNGSFGGINYFAYGGSSAATEDAEYYIDDVMLVDVTGVGIEDNNNAFNFNVYPNPVVNTLFLNASNVKAGNYNLEIFDITGKLALSQEIYVSNELSKELNVNFEAGMYTVSLSNENTVSTKKFIVK
jgi:hypothetical protein